MNQLSKKKFDFKIYFLCFKKKLIKPELKKQSTKQSEAKQRKTQTENDYHSSHHSARQIGSKERQKTLF